MNLEAQAEANIDARNAIFKQLRERRAALGLTVEDISERCSWPVERVTAFEHGVDSVTVRDLTHYAHAVDTVIQFSVSTD